MSSSAEAPVAIKFDHVTKTYKLYENDRQRFFSIFSSRDKRKLITKVNASNDLSFEIKKGRGGGVSRAQRRGKIDGAEDDYRCDVPN